MTRLNHTVLLYFMRVHENIHSCGNCKAHSKRNQAKYDLNAHVKLNVQHKIQKSGNHRYCFESGLKKYLNNADIFNENMTFILLLFLLICDTLTIQGYVLCVVFMNML